MALISKENPLWVNLLIIWIIISIIVGIGGALLTIVFHWDNGYNKDSYPRMDSMIDKDNTIVINVPDYNSKRLTDTKTVSWRSPLNMQKWKIIIKYNKTELNKVYNKFPRKGTDKIDSTILVLSKYQDPNDVDTLYDITAGFEQYKDKCPGNSTAFCIEEMVQSLPYVSDPESTGQRDYWRYPMETLIEGQGDCEDKAALSTLLLHLGGYNTAYVTIQRGEKGHALSAVDASQIPESAPFMYKTRTHKFLKNPDKWYIMGLTGLSEGFNVDNSLIEDFGQNWELTTDAFQIPTYYGETLYPKEILTTTSISQPTITTELTGPNTKESCTSLLNNRKQDLIFWEYVKNNNIQSDINEQTTTCHLKTASEANGLLQESPRPGSQTMKTIRGLLIKACVPCQDPNSAQPGRTQEIVEYTDQLITQYNSDYNYCIQETRDSN